MPIYEYVCLSCKNRFEQFQRMEEEPLEECPECSGVVKRLITGGSGFIMKGSDTIVTSFKSPTCGKDAPCCGRDIPCGKSEECNS
ncbi:MAG: FmdB family zinc ribbon protein [Spirochaetota bacterium]|nr:FmdB family zinc ribbon protein [Spirochaetota bacterium]